jgi:transposase-like protein
MGGWSIYGAPSTPRGEVLNVLAQSKRNRHAALKLMRKLLKKCAFSW